MTRFLDNFDVNFLHCLCVNRFMSALITTIIIIYISMSDSVFVYFCYIISTLVPVVRTNKYSVTSKNNR